MSKKISNGQYIHLSDHHFQYASQLVDSGKYPSIEAVLEAALSLLMSQSENGVDTHTAVELPRNFTSTSLNTFQDDNLQSLIEQLDAAENSNR